MKHLVCGAVLMCALAGLPALRAQGPELKKIGAMLIEGVPGEFDHFAVDLAHQRLYLAAEDHKTVEVFDLAKKIHVGSIALFGRPHGLVFPPGSSKLIVADGNDAAVKFIDPNGPKVSSQIKTELRADSVTFDAASRTMFVTNGGQVAKLDHSFVTAVNTTTGERISDTRLDSKI